MTMIFFLIGAWYFIKAHAVPQHFPEMSQGVDSNIGSYNSFLYQVGFCKMQSFDSHSRTTSGGPSMYVSGDVHFGVGLSHVQFGEGVDSNWKHMADGQLMCGACLEITHVDQFPWFNYELTDYDYTREHSFPMIAMVFDQCNDPICTSGYLDFDIYSYQQPVAFGNPEHISWRTIPCPVGYLHQIEYLFCDPESCHEGDIDRDAWYLNPYYFTILPRNMRLPIKRMVANGYELPYKETLGYVWTGRPMNRVELVLEVYAIDDSYAREILDITMLNGRPSTPGYRGGLVYHGLSQV